LTPQPTENRFANKADVTALLGAFCLFLSAVEYMLPKPMPFMRLGIANLPILLAVDLLPFPWFLVLALVKVVGMSVISGTLFSFIALFSLLGTLTAALVMWGARKAGGRHITQIGVSILGALTSNAAQIFIARYLIFGQAAWLIAPLFLAMGLATGTALGIFAEHFAWRSRWYAMALGRPYQGPKGEDGPALEKKQAPLAKKAGVEARMRRRQRFEAYFSPWSAAAGGAALALIFLFERNLAVKVGLFAFFIFAVLMAGKKFSFLTMVAVSSGIVLTNLLVPSGKVLGRLGPLVVTQYALTEGIIKALTFEGLMLISKASIMPGLKLPGRFGTIVASSFLYYDRIVEYKGRIRAATLSRDADDMMTGVWESLNADSAWAQVARPRFTAAPKARAGYLILSICVFAAGLAAFLAR
jgi:heptaprenyl diphosphate synthase